MPSASGLGTNRWGVARPGHGLARAELVALAAELEALIDFADEDLPDHVMRELRGKTHDLITALAGSLDDGGLGELVRDGVTIVLTGPVNAGKSTLLNALAGRPAAIVSDEAGTTRDIVQVGVDLGGVPARLLDTAGIRADSGVIEAEGIRRAKAAVETANLALLVVDGSDPEWGERAGVHQRIDHRRPAYHRKQSRCGPPVGISPFRISGKWLGSYGDVGTNSG